MKTLTLIIVGTAIVIMNNACNPQKRLERAAKRTCVPVCAQVETMALEQCKPVCDDILALEDLPMSLNGICESECKDLVISGDTKCIEVCEKSIANAFDR